MRSGRLLSCCALAVQTQESVVAVGNANAIVPYAENQQVTMRVNAHSLSGHSEEYVGGRLTVIGHGPVVPGGQFQFEITRWPKYGQIGWNNSASGQFVYSPRSYHVVTSNHGLDAPEPVPGCKYGCESCPNAARANAGISQPEPDPSATEECNGRLTRCGGFRSTLRDPDRPDTTTPLASEEQVRWVNGYVCAETSEEDEILYRRAKADHRLKQMDQDVRQRVECKDVPPRHCVQRSTTVPHDTFNFRVRNKFGVSNTATVTVTFDHKDQADMTLQFTVLIGFLMVLATCTGLVRVIVLQPLLHPSHEYKWLPEVLANTICPVAPEPFKRQRDPSHYKPEFMKEVALSWPPPGYEERREATLNRKSKAKQHGFNVNERAASPAAGKRRRRRDIHAEQVDNAMKRSLSKVAGGAESSIKTRKNIEIPKMKRKKKRNGANETEFDGMQSLSQDAPPAADGDARVSAAMDMLIPLPVEAAQPAQHAPMTGVSMLGATRESDWDDLDALDALEIDNPVANQSMSSSYGPEDMGDEV